MPRVSPAQTSFIGGEWAPRLNGRVDSDRYSTGLAVMQNYIAMAQGPAVGRSGTRFVKEVKNSANAGRLLPFKFSTTQAYVIEAGDLYFRFYANHGQVVSGPPVEVVTPYAAADLFQLKVTQSADVLYLTHPSYAPRKLTRTSATNFTLSTISFLDGPYLATNTTATTMTASGAGPGSVTVTASAATFVSTDVGRPIRIKSGATWGWGTITAFTSATVVTVNIVSAVGISATTTWRLGVWSATTGWPACAVFHEDRLVFGGPTNNPQRLDASNSGDYENFAPSANDGTIGNSNAFAVPLNSNDVNAIRWMVSDERGLMVGTSAGEWIVRPTTTGEALSATNSKAVNASTYGSANVNAVKARKATLFVQASGRKVYDVKYEYTIDGLEPDDLTEISEHITQPSVTEIYFQQEPHSIVWMPRADGQLIGLTYNRKTDSLRAGWHRHVLGGYSNVDQNEAAVVESITVIPEPNGKYDELWLLVRRHINGATKRYVEYMERMIDDSTLQEDCFFVDSGLTYTGAPTDTVTGLTHLIGQTVSILADGAPVPNQVVNVSGGVTLPDKASVIHVGLPFRPRGQMLRIEAGAADGAALGKLRRVHKARFLVYRSLGLNVGPSFYQMDPLPFRSTEDKMGVAIPLFSGIVEIEFDGPWDRDSVVCFEQDQPLPTTILAIMLQMETQDGG